MEKLITGDGSATFYSPEYKEFYHSKSGAVEEVIEKYIKPCGIGILARNGHLRILDVGFGLGYTALAAIDWALAENPGCRVEVISLEKDRALLKHVKSLKPIFRCHAILQKIKFRRKIQSFIYENNNIFLQILLGDASKTLKSISPGFDAVFLDPFSPPKNPELWTTDFISEPIFLLTLSNLLRSHLGILTTQ